VCARAVPVTLMGFASKLTSTSNSSAMRSRIQRAVQSWSPIARVEYAHLELPLAHHDFGVGPFNADTRALTRQRVGLDDVASGHLVAPTPQ